MPYEIFRNHSKWANWTILSQIKRNSDITQILSTKKFC